MFGRKCRSRLDLLLPDHTVRVEAQPQRQKEQHDLHTHSRGFSMGKQVCARNFYPGEAWLPGCIIKVTCPVSFLVKLTDGRVIRRHLDHVRKQPSEQETPESLSPRAQRKTLLCKQIPLAVTPASISAVAADQPSQRVPPLSVPNLPISVFNVLLFHTYSSST